MTDDPETSHLPPPGAPKRSTLGACLQLLRPPNLLTVPGDPLAGVMLAWSMGFEVGAARAALAAGSALLLYAAGLLLNDYFDLPEDARDRPNRPLPAGAAGPRAVLFVAVVLAGLGVAAAFAAAPAAGVVAVVLAGLVVAYDSRLKRIGLLGPAAMGACRGLSLCLGAAAAGGWPALAQPVVLAGAGMVAAYIAAVTLLAAREAEEVPIGLKRYLPAAVLAAGFAVLGSIPAPLNLGGWLLFALVGLGAIEWALVAVRPLAETPQPPVVQKAIGSLIRNLLVIQAALATVVLWPGVAIAAALLAVGLPGAWLLARRFYAS